MTYISRRNALRAAGMFGVAALAAGCTTSSAALDATIINDLKNLVPAVNAILAAVEQQAPNAISASLKAEIASLEAAANAALASLSSNTPVATGATTLQTIDIYLNDALSAIGAALPAAAAGIPALAQYIPAYDAAVALITGVLEPYINSLLTPTAPAPAGRKPLYFIGRAPSIPAARATLGIHA